VAYFLALASAALYGAADFLGGLASRQASTVAIVIVSQGAGLIPLVFLLMVFPAEPTWSDFVWGAAAGLAGGVGVALLYRALSIGTMSVVAPTTAVCAVMLPVFFDALTGEPLPLLTQGGIALAIVSIVLVSQHDAPAATGQPGRRGLPPGLAIAFASGVAIGLFFLALTRTSPAAGLWPLLASRGLSILIFGIVAVAGARRLGLPPPVLKTAVACGVLDMVANALYLIASRGGRLSVVVTLASLYPASTVILARIVVGERLGRRQGIGIVCALVAVVVIVGTS
jgi:drug/metabolite transporter (DMT)-like permease